MTLTKDEITAINQALEFAICEDQAFIEHVFADIGGACCGGGGVSPYVGDAPWATKEEQETGDIPIPNGETLDNIRTKLMELLDKD